MSQSDIAFNNHVTNLMRIYLMSKGHEKFCKGFYMDLGPWGGKTIKTKGVDTQGEPKVNVEDRRKEYRLLAEQERRQVVMERSR